MPVAHRRISDARCITLLWETIKAGHSDAAIFRAPVKVLRRVAYCRNADDFILMSKASKHRRKLSGKNAGVCSKAALKLNMGKTRITHVNYGFIFFGHRLIRKRSRYGNMWMVTTIPRDTA